MTDAATSEKRILAETLISLSAEPETLVYRNNTGSAWTGREVRAPVGTYIKIEPGTMVLKDARPIKFGLLGSGDIMGASHGRPVAVECKTVSGRQSEVQKNFERAWTRAGGIYVLVREPKLASVLIREKL